jgi:hypothetical protein
VHIIGEALALVPLHESAQGQLPTYAGHALMSEEGSEPDIESRRVEVAAANRPPLVPD